MLEPRRGANGRKESRAGGKKVGQKIVKKTRIVIDNHRFEHKNNVMLELKKRRKRKNPDREPGGLGKVSEKVLNLMGVRVYIHKKQG